MPGVVPGSSSEASSSRSTGVPIESLMLEPDDQETIAARGNPSQDQAEEFTYNSVDSTPSSTGREGAHLPAEHRPDPFLFHRDFRQSGTLPEV